MAVGRAASGGGVPIIVAVLATVAAPMAAYAVVRSAAIDAAGNAADPSATLPPRNLLPQLKAAMRAARRPEDRIPASAVALARQAALKIPLAYEPYYIVGRAEEQAGRYGRATLLLEEARRRRPNATSVRVALLGYYSLADAYQKAIDEADMAMRINSRSAALILPAFAKLVAADPKARQAIAVALAKRPPWRNDFLDVAAREKMTPAIAKALVADIRRLAPSRTAEAEEAFLVRSLFEAGEYREARSLWESYRAPGASQEIVTDGKFVGTPAMAPFGWTLRSDKEGTAEIAKTTASEKSALELDYFGGAQMALAEQVLGARPGAYQLSSLLTGQSSAADLGLTWRLYCLPSNLEIAALPLQPFTETVSRRQVAVSIPTSGCAAQKLALIGSPGDVPRTLSAQISEVALRPVGRTAPGRAAR